MSLAASYPTRNATVLHEVVQHLVLLLEAHERGQLSTSQRLQLWQNDNWASRNAANDDDERRYHNVEAHDHEHPSKIRESASEFRKLIADMARTIYTERNDDNEMSFAMKRAVLRACFVWCLAMQGVTRGYLGPQNDHVRQLANKDTSWWLSGEPIHGVVLIATALPFKVVPHAIAWAGAKESD